jgi:hypothetical protein
VQSVRGNFVRFSAPHGLFYGTAMIMLSLTYQISSDTAGHRWRQSGDVIFIHNKLPSCNHLLLPHNIPIVTFRKFRMGYTQKNVLMVFIVETLGKRIPCKTARRHIPVDTSSRHHNENFICRLRIPFIYI